MSDNPNVIPRRPDGSFLAMALEVTQAAIEVLLTGALAQLTQINAKTVKADTDAVAIVSSALPAGAATDAALLSLIQTAQDLLVELSGKTEPTDVQLVAGPLTDVQLRASAVSVSADSLPLPAGASTEATLAQIRAKADNLDIPISSLTKPADTQLVQVVNWPPDLGGADDVQSRFDIRNDVIFVGSAPLGAGSAALQWKIQRIDLIDGNPVQARWSASGVAWDDRESESYS